MEKFSSMRGVAAPIDRANIDTDAIIPKQFLKSIARTGFGVSLFFDWRYLPDGSPNPDFILNQPAYRKSTILVARNNFGCGSSREHAVWAIAQFGFRAVIAPWIERHSGRVPAFADIFKNNCVKNSLLTIELSEMEVEKIFQACAAKPGTEISVDLERQHVVLHGKEEVYFHFDIDPSAKERLLNGLDDIAISLKYADQISQFEKKHNAQL